METLDTILARADISNVDYLKIDVEGYELPVLRGARGIIAASPEIVVQVEHTEANRYGHSLDAAAELLSGLKLLPFRPDASGALHAAEPDRLGADLWPDALQLHLAVEQDGARRLTWNAPSSWEARWPPL